MRNLAIYLFSAVIMSSAVDKSDDKKQVLTYRVLRSAIRIDYDTYRVFYEEDLKWKSTKGTLPELIRKGFDVSEVILMAE